MFWMVEARQICPIALDNASNEISVNRTQSRMQSDTFYWLCLRFSVNCNHAGHPEDDDKKDAEDWVDGPGEALAQLDFTFVSILGSFLIIIVHGRLLVLLIYRHQIVCLFSWGHLLGPGLLCWFGSIVILEYMKK